jgi:hypothetical protein
VRGGGALGSAAFGVIAQNAGLTGALLTASIGLTLVALAGLWLPFKAIPPAELLPAGDWPAPRLAGATATDGPVLVTLEYRPRPGLEQDLVDARYGLRRARHGTGAVSWRVWETRPIPGTSLSSSLLAPGMNTSASMNVSAVATSRTCRRSGR